MRKGIHLLSSETYFKALKSGKNSVIVKDKDFKAGEIVIICEDGITETSNKIARKIEKISPRKKREGYVQLFLSPAGMEAEFYYKEYYYTPLVHFEKKEKRKAFSSPEQKAKAQTKWESKKASIGFRCEPELKENFDKEREARDMSQPEFLEFLLKNYNNIL